MWNDGAVVLILKWTAPPTFTLICVAKPWIVGSPAPLTSHVDCGVPTKQFSATTEFAGDAHGPVPAALATPAAWGAAARTNEAHRAAAIAAIRRGLPPRARRPALIRTAAPQARRRAAMWMCARSVVDGDGDWCAVLG